MMATLPKAKPSVISVSNLHMPFHIPGEASKRPTHNNTITAGLTHQIQINFPVNYRAEALVGRALTRNTKIGKTLEQLHFLEHLKNRKLLPKHLTNMKFPKIFQQRPETDISGNFRDLIPSIASSYTKQAEKWKRRCREFQRFCLKMEIAEKHAMLKLHRHNLENTLRSLSGEVTEKQLHVIREKGKQWMNLARTTTSHTHRKKLTAIQGKEPTTLLHHKHPQSETVSNSLVNASSINDIDNNCERLLSRGPGFMLSHNTPLPVLMEDCKVAMERTICAIRYSKSSYNNTERRTQTGDTRPENLQAPDSLRSAASSFPHTGIKPPIRADPETEDKIRKLREELRPIWKASSKTWEYQRNHRKEEFTSLKQTLSNHPELSVLPTDKTGRMCLLDTNLVEDKIKDQMRVGWEPLDADPSHSYETAANNILSKCLSESRITDHHIAGRLKTYHSAAPGLFPLAKDHKPGFPNVKLRIVQPVKGGAVEKLDFLVSRVLTQILPTLPHRVASTDEFIQLKLKPLQQSLPLDVHQTSLDMESMYPTIPTDERAMSVVLRYIKETPNIDLLGFQPDHICEMLQFVCRHTYAHIGSNFYRQTTGIGTGYHSSGAYAEIIVDFLYNSALGIVKEEEKPLSLTTYVDDSHLLWKEREHSETFFSILSGIWPSVRFTKEEATMNKHGEREISFLDLKIRTSNQDGISHLEWELFQKPTNSGTYLNFISHCPRTTKMNIIRTEAHRILNRCSSLTLALPHLEKLRENLVRSGYPALKVSMEITKEMARPDTRNTTNSGSSPPADQQYVLKIPYTNEMALRQVKRAVKSSELPIRVVPSSGKTVANICKNTYRRRNTPDCDCTLHQHGINCRIRHAVYRATCKLCHDECTYVGATNRPLMGRINEHEAATRLGHTDASSVAEHANFKHFEHLRGDRGRREYENFFNMFDFDIVNKCTDPIDTYLREHRAIIKLKPSLNRMADNGWIH